MNSPEKNALPFSEIVKIRFRDMDAQGHLYFANYMVYADEVLGAYMEQLGLDALSPHKAPCLIFTVNIRCEYLSEIAGNGEVKVCVGYARLGNSSADAVFEIYNNASGVLLAKGGLTQVFVDHESRKSMPIPPLFKAGIVEQQPELGDN
ncbi:1,4-dihydroxy-2-naphthoyl-CoA hydrolase [Halioglobus japonicus]|nr:1,4-dihydroxy-2-naphthoyl-CoA hydrolase [Halioglobus japonicus]